MTDDVASIDLADMAFAEGRPQDALRHYVALLNADPGDLFALYRTSLLLGRLGDPDTALETLDLAALRIAESGQLLLALAARSAKPGANERKSVLKVIIGISQELSRFFLSQNVSKRKSRGSRFGVHDLVQEFIVQRSVE